MKIFLAYSDHDDKPENPAEQETFWTRVQNLGYEWKDGKLEDDQKQKVIELYYEYHKKEALDWTIKINE